LDETQHLVKLGENGETPDCAASVARIERVLTRPGALWRHHQFAGTVAFEESVHRAPEEDVLPDVSVVEKWLGNLAPLDRLVVRLRFWEDMGLSDIALLLKITPAKKVYSILRRALRILRTEAEKEALE
jgi:DNA-directed RNA polymerase specialized sigma24 family protein